jgi:hypothetical protein
MVIKCLEVEGDTIHLFRMELEEEDLCHQEELLLSYILDFKIMME